MRARYLIHLLSFFVIIFGLLMLIPAGVSLLYGEPEYKAFIYACALSCLPGAFILMLTRTQRREVSHREGFIFVASTWLISGFVGALPYLLIGQMADQSIHFSLTDAFFEAISGFTTTGATIIVDIEALPKGLLFFRSLTHWLGGMGIILLSLCILPLLGVGGMQLYKAEVPGPTTDKIFPKIADTAKVLWGIYLLFTLVEIILLYIGGMTLFDSICHTFGTLATGGFSTKNMNVEYYHSIYLQGVITFFMFLAGVNFTLHFSLLRGNLGSFRKNTEFKFYCSITLFFITLITLSLYFSGTFSTLGKALQYGSVQVLSIITTTGYSTHDFESWNSASQFILFTLMFVGGSAGSTSGGIKCMRLLILLRLVYVELKKIIHPHGVFPIKVNKQVVSKEVIQSVYGFFFLYLSIFIVCALFISFFNIDMISSISIIAASLGNIGPGFGSIGPHENYAHLPMVVKWVSIFCMLLGRLEIYTLILLFIPDYWKK
jgi:trk system potassium uptake protein